MYKLNGQLVRWLSSRMSELKYRNILSIEPTDKIFKLYMKNGDVYHIEINFREGLTTEYKMN